MSAGCHRIAIESATWNYTLRDEVVGVVAASSIEVRHPARIPAMIASTSTPIIGHDDESQLA
eukprot:1055045-Rhodomonas_salina.2